MFFKKGLNQKDCSDSKIPAAVIFFKLIAMKFLKFKTVILQKTLSSWTVGDINLPDVLLHLTPFNEGPLRTSGGTHHTLPWSCTAFSQALSIKSVQWRIRGELAGNVAGNALTFRLDHVPRNALVAQNNEG